MTDLPTPSSRVKTHRICINLRNDLWQKWGGHVHPVATPLITAHSGCRLLCHTYSYLFIYLLIYYRFMLTVFISYSCLAVVSIYGQLKPYHIHVYLLMFCTGYPAIYQNGLLHRFRETILLVEKWPFQLEMVG